MLLFFKTLLHASRLLNGLSGRRLICENCLCSRCKTRQNITFMDKRRDKPHSKVDIDDMNPYLSSSGNKGSGGGNVGKSREEGRRLKGEV